MRYGANHRVRQEEWYQLLGTFVLYSPFFTPCKGETREEKLIAYNHFDVT